MKLSLPGALEVFGTQYFFLENIYNIETVLWNYMEEGISRSTDTSYIILTVIVFEYLASIVKLEAKAMGGGIVF
jgi:hypothetical protein